MTKAVEVVNKGDDKPISKPFYREYKKFIDAISEIVSVIEDIIIEALE